MPAIDGRVVLHAGIAALPGGFGHFAHQIASAEFLHGLSVVHVAGPPIAVLFHGAHEVVGHAHRVVGVLEENGGIGLAVDRGVIALLDQHLGLALLLHFGLDEFLDVRVIHIQNHHLRGAARLSAALDYSGERVEALHEAHRARSDAASGKRLAAAAQGGKIRAGAGAPLE